MSLTAVKVTACACMSVFLGCIFPSFVHHSDDDNAGMWHKLWCFIDDDDLVLKFISQTWRTVT